MARLRLGIAGLLLFVIAATGFGLGGASAAGIERAASQLEDVRFDPLRDPGEAAAFAGTVSIDDPDDDLHADDFASRAGLTDTPAADAAARVAGPRPNLQPRATGPPASSIV